MKKLESIEALEILTTQEMEEIKGGYGYVPSGFYGRGYVQ